MRFILNSFPHLEDKGRLYSQSLVFGDDAHQHAPRPGHGLVLLQPEELYQGPGIEPAVKVFQYLVQVGEHEVYGYRLTLEICKPDELLVEYHLCLLKHAFDIIRL